MTPPRGRGREWACFSASTCPAACWPRSPTVGRARDHSSPQPAGPGQAHPAAGRVSPPPGRGRELGAGTSSLRCLWGSWDPALAPGRRCGGCPLPTEPAPSHCWPATCPRCVSELLLSPASCHINVVITVKIIRKTSGQRMCLVWSIGTSVSREPSPNRMFTVSVERDKRAAAPGPRGWPHSPVGSDAPGSHSGSLVPALRRGRKPVSH